jgi:hypothetical protein
VTAEPGTDVAVDGVLIGTTPFRPVPLALGAHTVELAHPSLGTAIRQVTISSGAMAELRLERSHAPVLPPSPTTTSPRQATGSLVLVVTPWAKVSLDGREVGTTPFGSSLKLPAGRHAVRLDHPAYHPLHREITITAGETTRLEVDLGWEGFKKE